MVGTGPTSVRPRFGGWCGIGGAPGCGQHDTTPTRPFPPSRRLRGQAEAIRAPARHLCSIASPGRDVATPPAYPENRQSESLHHRHPGGELRGFRERRATRTAPTWRGDRDTPWNMHRHEHGVVANRERIRRQDHVPSSLSSICSRPAAWSSRRGRLRRHRADRLYELYKCLAERPVAHAARCSPLHGSGFALAEQCLRLRERGCVAHRRKELARLAQGPFGFRLAEPP